jgi:hypothetical protein
MENLMKKLSFILVLAAAIAALPGCASLESWWASFEANPLEQVQTFEAGVGIAVSDATVAFQVVKNYLSASDQVQAQNDFNTALVTIDNAESALNAAVQAAVDAQQTNVNFTALITAVNDAVQAIVAIVNQYSSAPPAPASATAAFGTRPTNPLGLAQATAVLANLRRFEKPPATTKK